MPSLDLLERKLLKIFAESSKVKLKRRMVKSNSTSFSDEEKRERINMLLRRLYTLPEHKQQEVRALLRLYHWEL